MKILCLDTSWGYSSKAIGMLPVKVRPIPRVLGILESLTSIHEDVTGQCCPALQHKRRLSDLLHLIHHILHSILHVEHDTACETVQSNQSHQMGLTIIMTHTRHHDNMIVTFGEGWQVLPAWPAGRRHHCTAR